MDKLGLFHANQISMCLLQVGETKLTTTGSVMNYLLNIHRFQSQDRHQDLCVLIDIRIKGDVGTVKLV